MVLVIPYKPNFSSLFYSINLKMDYLTYNGVSKRTARLFLITQPRYDIIVSGRERLVLNSYPYKSLVQVSFVRR